MTAFRGRKSTKKSVGRCIHKYEGNLGHSQVVSSQLEISNNNDGAMIALALAHITEYQRLNGLSTSENCSLKF